MDRSSDCCRTLRHGEAACGRSVDALKVMVSKRRMNAAEIEKAPEILPIPKVMPMTDEEKEDFVRDRYNEVIYALANSNAKTTTSRTTLH